jgi:hypothetical protein
MDANFTITVQNELDLVRVSMSGFFFPSDVERFRHARDEAHLLLRSLPNQHLTIVDIREMKVQAQETVAAFQAVLGEKRHHGRRLAIVAGSSLARSQAKRASQRVVAYFAAVEEAEQWLLQSDEIPQATAA